MPDPGIGETAALVAAQENLPANPANRRQQFSAEVTRLTNESHFREGLKKLAESREVDFGGFERKLAGFGVDINPTTGARQLSAEEVTYKAAIDLAKTNLTNFFDKGYDGMGARQGAIRDIIIQQARRNPAMAAQLNQPGFNAQAFAERYLRDPAFLAHLKGILNESLEGNYDNSVLDAYDEWRAKDQARQDAQLKFDEMQRRRNASTGRLRPFERTAAGAPRGNATSATTIDNLQDSSGQDAVDVALLQQEISRFEQQISRLEQEKMEAQKLTRMRPQAAIEQSIRDSESLYQTALSTYQGNPNNPNRLNAENTRMRKEAYEKELADRQDLEARVTRPVADIDGAINDIETNELPGRKTELATKLGNSQRLKDLEQRQGQLEDNRAELEEAFAKASAELRAAEEEASKARRNYESARTVRLAAEKTLSERLTNAYGEAGLRTINDMLQEAVNKFDGELVKLKESEKDQHAKEALDALQSRWQMPPEVRQRGPWWNRRVETHRPINKQQLGDDFDTLLNQGDTDLVRNILTGRINPTTNAPYTPDQINSLLDKKEFMDKIGTEAVKQLLAQRFLTGGFRREDINIIARSQWGPKVIDQSVSQNVDYQRMVATVMREGSFNRTGFRERFGKIAVEKPWLIYSLLGVPVATIIAMFGSSANELIQNQN